MDFGDAKPQLIPRFGSQVEWDAVVQLPLGLASRVRNCRYTAQSVATRWGFSLRLTFGQGAAVSSAGLLRYLSPDLSGSETTKLIVYTQNDGNIYSALPFSQTSITPLTTNSVLSTVNTTLKPGMDPMMAQAFNRMFVVQGDLTFGRGQSWVIDPQQNTIDPISDKPLGAPWNPSTAYRVGQVVSPSEFQTNGLPAEQGSWVSIDNGHLYRCIAPGTSGANQPTWPKTLNGTVADNTARWQECTPQASAGIPDPQAPTGPTVVADPSSPIAPGATVYVALTYVSAQGEGINTLSTTQGAVDTTKVLVYQNTGANAVDLSCIVPPIPAQYSTSGPLGANGAIGYNAYAFVVQGTVDTSQVIDPSFYAKVNSSTLNPGNTLTISTWPSGDPLPTVNTANIADTGNVDSGVRWMVVLFETRTQYYSGIGATAPIQVRVDNDGRRILAQYLPIGPYNTIARVCAFTVAGGTSAGPYYFIDADDTESPGFNEADIPITATRINNNTDTSAQFNFTDTYLPGGYDVTNYFNRIEVPPASDVYFSKTLSQVVFTGCKGFPSGYLVSDFQDPEAVRVPGSQVQVSETDGDRTVCWREIRETQIALKENSGHAIVPNNGDASTWATQRLWGGAGPVGPKAIDIGFEGDAEYFLFAHRTGLYRFSGTAPQMVSREMQKTWDRINWEYGYLIRVCIDNKHREARILVPMDGSTVRNKCITLNFFYGWDDPVIFAQRSGRLVPNVNGRKWSVDDIAASDMVYLEQRYDASHTANIDRNYGLLKCGADGAIYTLTEGQYFDHDYSGNQVGYLSEWLSVPGSNPALGLVKLLGATCSAIGNGQCVVYAQDDTALVTIPLSNPLRSWTLATYETQRDFAVVAVPESPRYAIGFTNNGVAGAWFEMHAANLWIAPTFASRIG